LILESKDLSVFYDTAQVLDHARIAVDAGEFVSVVGPNGAGKSTLLRHIAGLIRWERKILKGTRFGDILIEGSIVFDGERIDGLEPYEIARRGLILCPERGRLFSELTVAENLKVGAYLVKDKSKVSDNLERVYTLFPRLKERAKQISGTVSGGERQMLSIGRALMSQPKLLCVDEPSLGLAPMIKRDLFNRMGEIYKMGITILLIEQDVRFAFGLSNRNYVFSRGRVVAEGKADELLQNEAVKKTYLGM
jgi:branched-chain amino acid transport system ATP-binding protein